MKENKILNAIPRMRFLSEERLDFVLEALDHCEFVQDLETKTKNRKVRNYTKKLDDLLIDQDSQKN